MKPAIKVLIIDDSALIRQLLTSILESENGIEVVGVAKDPLDAREKIKRLNPDVLTLDVEMPKMDGITFLKNLMRLRPMPVVMISSVTEEGAEVTLEALEIGAVDFIAKPKIDIQDKLLEYSDVIVEKVRVAASAKVREYDIKKRALLSSKKYDADVVLKKRKVNIKSNSTDKIIAIGASTGGTEAIMMVLKALPENSPAIVISQHIPAAFSKAFAERVNRQCRVTVCEAEHGQKVIPGHVYIAPGNRMFLQIK